MFLAGKGVRQLRTGSSKNWLAAIGPGILVAATGVGAGDLISAGVAGSRVGLVIAWAALAGGVLKWFLNEGIARWQMATGTTLLEGWATRLGRWVRWVFLVYLLVWTFITAGTLASACGVAGSGLLPLCDDLRTSKIIWGALHSVVGLWLVWVGGFKLFEKMMAACIAVMFVTVILTAVLIRPDWAELGRGLVTPRVPDEPADALSWVLGVLGGVGGTVTLLCYGYWIREEGREGETGLRACRIDLGVGYAMTALFGIAMIVIGSRVTIAGGGADVALVLASQLEARLGALGRWAFLVGFWGAVFSSLLGVWQSVPYLFADFLTLRRGPSTEERAQIDYRRTAAYRWYLVAMATVPLVLLGQKMIVVQKAYAVFGSLFVLLLALALPVMNNRRAWVGSRFRSGWVTNAMLAGALLFFLYEGLVKLLSGLGR